MVASDALLRPALEFAARDFPVLDEGLTIGEALDHVRNHGLRDKIIYFYVTGGDGRLVGVLPARRLLTEAVTVKVADAMIRKVVAVPDRATLLDACEFFVLHKFLAFPVVDADRKIVGVLDVSVFTGEVMDLAEREQMDDVFQSLGVRVSELRSASVGKAFRLRFPWLIATIAGGTACAMLAGNFAETLEERIVLAFFLSLVLGLGESVSAQAVAVTLQAMHRRKPTLGWVWQALRKELATAVLLGAACGFVVGLIVWGWKGDVAAGGVIGLSICLAMATACGLGVLIPACSRLFSFDPKIAAGPLTLALADVCTLAIYFSLAKWMLTGSK